MKTNKFIVDKDFAMVVVDDFEEYGVKVGHRVFVVGHRAIPEDERDPYTQRIKFFVHLLDGKHVDASRLYVMDPRSLKKVKKGEQHELEKIMAIDFAIEEQKDATIN